MIRNNKSSYFLLVLFIAFSCAQPNSKKQIVKADTPDFNLKIEPVNELAYSKSLEKTVAVIQKAIETADTNLLFTVMDSNVIVSHGGAEYGFKIFKQHWKNNTTDLWLLLDHLLSLGGCFINDSASFAFPYCNNDKYYKKIGGDWYSLGVCTKANTPFYIEPQFDSKMFDSLNHAIFNRVLGHRQYDKNGFYKVKIAGTHTIGYLHAEDVYVTNDYSLHLTKSSNNWLITSFAVYD
ncbi:MAG: hypothetical protein ACPGLV_00435 [Bacteroidia bacterium]